MTVGVNKEFSLRIVENDFKNVICIVFKTFKTLSEKRERYCFIYKTVASYHSTLNVEKICI